MSKNPNQTLSCDFFLLAHEERFVQIITLLKLSSNTNEAWCCTEYQHDCDSTKDITATHDVAVVFSIRNYEMLLHIAWTELNVLALYS